MKIECTGLGQLMDVNTGAIDNVLILQNSVTGELLNLPVSEEAFQAILAFRGEQPPEEAAPAPTNGAGTAVPSDFLEPAPSMGSISEGLARQGEGMTIDDATALEDAAYMDLPDLGEEYSL